MIIFKKSILGKKNLFLNRLKGLIAKIVSLPVIAAATVFIATPWDGQAAFAQQSSRLKLEAMTAEAVDAESLQHLLSTALVNLEGEELRISDYQDKVIVLNFWASWCPPCVEEMPELAAIDKDFEAVQVIAYGVDTEQNIRRFIDKVPVDLPILIGEPSAFRLTRQLGNPSGGLPFTLIFAPGVELAYKIIGQVNAEELRHKLAEMTAEGIGLTP